MIGLVSVPEVYCLTRVCRVKAFDTTGFSALTGAGRRVAAEGRTTTEKCEERG
jgi:hypothetical protein